jgi:predicted esterase
VALLFFGTARGDSCHFSAGQFTTRETASTRYVVYVPSRPDGSLVVGLHGCGDSAANFASWSVAPAGLRATQSHVALSLDGASQHGCWDIARDGAKVLAAINDVSRCLTIDRKRIVLAGYSSGGMLAYAVALKHRVAGVLIENSTIRHIGDIDRAIAGSPGKFPVAQLAHSEDHIFPLLEVQHNLERLVRAGFPVEVQIQPGDHQGSSADWEWLLARMKHWLNH